MNGDLERLSGLSRTIDQDSCGELLDVVTMTCYAERSLLVPFDPKWDYAGEVQAGGGSVAL
jgi:hypothetical protein